MHPMAVPPSSQAMTNDARGRNKNSAHHKAQFSQKTADFARPSLALIVRADMSPKPVYEQLKRLIHEERSFCEASPEERRKLELLLR